MITDAFPVPYYAVIFTSIRTPEDAEGYDQAAQRMLELVREQSGFLGVESARGDDGLGITVSYWSGPEAILAWKQHPEHRAIRERGRSTWYQGCTTRVARVERSYSYST
ncbi:MAG TPA: antibiotic biosynthesis monooxygenase [Pseudomonas sp.]|uniref:antibiotic biosynthesis monooxygenase family protein n=1 Tax=Pseudomonas sp. TaxID=306 RepID=UPI002ED7F2BC